MDKKTVALGIGNCGCQVSALAARKYPELFDAIYINSSETDLAMISSDGLKFKIGTAQDINGSAKNRAKMKQYLLDDINSILGNIDLQDIISEKKYCFVIASTAGGTGSGSAPILMELLGQMFPDTSFILVGVLPSMNASLMELGNTLEFLSELYEVLGENTTYMIYDNDTTSSMSPTTALEIVNENIVEDLRVLTGVDNYPTCYESIDEADMESIMTTPGRLLVARVKKDLTEKYMEDYNIDELIVKTIKKSCNAETDRNKKVTRWGVITYLNNEVNQLYTANLDAVTQFLGTPLERFNHNAVHDGPEALNFIYLIASGLSPINDRVRKITTRIDELKAALAKDSASQYVLAGEGAAYGTAQERKKNSQKPRPVSEINPKDIFKKFMQ